jgi:radical SAM/Cys-rich protein
LSTRLPIVSVADVPAATSFADRLASAGCTLDRKSIDTVQVNIGKLCNQACKHCHVESGPTKTAENMDRRTVRRVLDLVVDQPSVKTVDVTGGAPELNANFRWFVRELRQSGRQVIDRCNLTVLSEPGQEDTAQFLADNAVTVVASLPCYSAENVDRQRGRGVFEKSIDALRQLNALGYGRDDANLVLGLVYNPVGPSLPPPQSDLQADYKRRLKADFDIDFTHLITITNLPIKRFRWDLERSGRLDTYMDLLHQHFNPRTAELVMCRSLISISWDGKIFDCDFNQMLDLPIGGRHHNIWDIDSLDSFIHKPIAVANHCYGCTAGAGSSCAGSLT